MHGSRASPRRERRRAGWDMRFGILMVFPLVCLVVVLYEFLYLQQYTASDAANTQDAAALQANANSANINANNNNNNNVYPTTQPRLRTDDKPVFTPAPAPTTVIRGRRTMVLIANYRDSKRCAETLRSIFDNAVSPELIKISIFDQIYEAENEIQCVDTFCALVGEANCRRKQIVSDKIDAANATGPTMGRYRTENAITDEDFCMAIDSHLIFIPKWDENLIGQWEETENENAIITVYPKATEHWFKRDADDKVQLMCRARIETEDADSMIQYGTIEWLDKKNVPKPRLMSQLAGGFNFGNCKQAKEVRNDPYTPYLFHGEEYSRAARLWTSGYDFYTPRDDVVYHWYETRKVVWERDWGKRWVIQQASKRRIRHCLGLPVTQEDFDRTDIDKFKLGTKRTFEQWKEFSGIDPTAKFQGKGVDQFNVCKELKLVPFNN